MKNSFVKAVDVDEKGALLRLKYLLSRGADLSSNLKTSYSFRS